MDIQEPLIYCVELLYDFQITMVHFQITIVHSYGIFLDYHGTHTDNRCIDDHNMYAIRNADHPYNLTTCMQICILYDQHFCRTMEIGTTYCQGSYDTLVTADSYVWWNCADYDFWERSVLRNAGQCKDQIVNCIL